ncbi:MAG: hypothetical protein JW940_33695 [Polyangiaceae bacterium]|nr:hypothetical protein [Polyangiaceae bacterium]
MTRRYSFLREGVLSSLCPCLAACGPVQQEDDRGGFESSGVTGDAECAAECDWAQRCAGPAVISPTREECIATCRARWGTAPVYRADLFEAFASCFQTLACGVSNDACVNQLVVTPPPADDPRVQACLAQHEACDATGTSFRDDRCGIRPVLIVSAQTAFDLCVSKACGEIAACVDAVLGRTD